LSPYNPTPYEREVWELFPLETDQEGYAIEWTDGSRLNQQELERFLARIDPKTRQNVATIRELFGDDDLEGR
jgi:hypothetical protein